MERVILSPHLDDAVLSCWHLLDGPDPVRILNVFTALPPVGTATPWWDRLTGATDARQRMRERHEEDRRALRSTRRPATALDLLDNQYRDFELPEGEVVKRLEAEVDPAEVLHAPAGIDGHPDHILVRDAALTMVPRGLRVELYADLPHAIVHGWPAWVTGEPEDLGIAQTWTNTLAGAGLLVEHLVPRVRPLDASGRKRKLEALAAYKSQRGALDRVAFSPLEEPRVLGWEVSWEVPASALVTGGLRERGREPVVADGRRKLLDDRG
jgi:LmbE family N-acetylglucosaminyl deacetylase